jgi:hypothetical protein
VQKIRHYERMVIVAVVFADSSDNVVLASSCSIVVVFPRTFLFRRRVASRP